MILATAWAAVVEFAIKHRGAILRIAGVVAIVGFIFGGYLWGWYQGERLDVAKAENSALKAERDLVEMKITKANAEWEAYAEGVRATLERMNHTAEAQAAEYESHLSTSRDITREAYARLRELESRPAQTITSTDCETAAWQFFGEVGVTP